MPKKIIIAEQERIAALLSDGRVDKLIVAQGRYQIGDIYLGTIENVLPGIDAAFVNIGASEKNGFIHVTDLGPLKIKQTAASITELLRPSQKVLVQVMKEPTGNKGPRLTGKVSLPGRYLVLQPNGQGVNISRKINTETERNRLKALGVLIKPPGTGLLIRYEAETISEELIIEDLENLLKKWELIQQAAERANPPTLLNRDEDFIHRVLRDHANADLSEVIVETSEASERANKFLEQNDTKVTVEDLQEGQSLIGHYKVDLAILNALKPRVDLPSGGYIIIEPTEALTVVDVNSGSFTRSANARETVLWTNCEAGIEIARQLKLRNIGGVIIIDFIDMESRRDQLQLLEYFTAALNDDSSRPQISQLTELGLVEMTRKRQGQNIYELFSKECNNCNGLGHNANIPGKEQIKPSALNAGLIKSEPQDLVNTTLNTNNKIKLNEPVLENNEINSKGNISKSNEKESYSEKTPIKKEPEHITVEMNDDEELVFSNLGLSPALILDNLPSNNNILFEVVKPTKDHNKKTDLTITYTENVNQKRSQELNPGSNSSTTFVEEKGHIQLTHEEEGSPSLEKRQEYIPKINPENVSKDEPKNIKDAKESEQEAEDPRRRRRRSSNETDNKNITTEAEKGAKETKSSEQEEEVEDPRRRRRRSSATS